MRNSPVILAIAAAAIGVIYGCSLPLEGLSVNAHGGGGGGGGATSVTSAGGALSTTTGMTSTGSAVVSCTLDSECTGGSECKTPKCTNGACGFETASLDATVCGAAPAPCFDESQCADGECAPRPKPAATIVDDAAPGNCTSLVCDGSGVSTPVANTADLPMDQDSSDCAVPVCNGTTAGTTTLIDGAGCGNGKHCLAGQCRECASDSDCGNDLTSCTFAVCNAGTCGQEPMNNGKSCGIGGKCAAGGCCYTPICGGGTQCCFAFQHCDALDKCTF